MYPRALFTLWRCVHQIFLDRTRAAAGIGSACGLGASPTPDLRDLSQSRARAAAGTGGTCGEAAKGSAGKQTGAEIQAPAAAGLRAGRDTPCAWAAQTHSHGRSTPPVVFLCAALPPPKPAICFGPPKKSFGVPNPAPRVELAACSD
jgi:hypothetical protein